jgi:hypothetical protein
MRRVSGWIQSVTVCDILVGLRYQQYRVAIWKLAAIHQLNAAKEQEQPVRSTPVRDSS